MILKLFHRIYWSILLVLIALSTIVAIMISTEYGANLLLQLAVAATHQQLSYKAVKGRLIENLEVSQLTYHNDNINISIDNISLNWNPVALFNKKIAINDLILTNAHINLHPQQNNNTTNKSFNPDLLKNWQLVIKDISLNNIFLSKNNTPKLVIKNISGNLLYSSHLTANLSATTAFPIKLNTQFTLHGNLEQYLWQLTVNGDSSNLAISGQGNSQGTDFVTDHSNFLRGNFAAKGYIHWQPKLAWDIHLAANKLSLAIKNLQPISLQIDSAGNLQAFNFLLSDIQGMYNHTPLTGYLKLTSVLPKALAEASDELTIKYFLEQLKLDIDAKLQLGVINAVIQGKLDQRWNMRFNIQAPQLNKIAKSVTGAFAFAGTIQGNAIAPTLNADLDLQRLALSNFKPGLFQGKINIKTDLTSNNQLCSQSGNLTLLNSGCNFQITAALNQSELTINQSKQILHFPLNGNLQANFNNKGLTSTLSLSLYNKNFLSADFNVPGYQLGEKLASNRAIAAHLLINLDQTQLGGYHIPQTSNLQASLTTDLKLTGSMNKPVLFGSAVLNSPSLTIPEYNIHLSHTNLHVQANNNNLSYQGSSSSGGGNLQLKGQSLFQDQHISSTLSFTGTRFLISDTAELQAYISPDLNIVNQPDGWHISGHIDIPSARINMPNTSEVLTLPTETIITNGSSSDQPKNSALSVYSNVLIRLGDDINLDAKGFTGKLTGQLNIKESPISSAIGVGSISISQGSYAIRGNKLNIDHGHIYFNNSLLNNPNLDIQASKKIKYNEANQTIFDNNNLQVGVLVTGTANNPVVKLFANPAHWSQADILSFIILGQPASASSGSNLQLLMRATQALNTPGKFNIGSLQDNLQNSLGLSEFQFVSGANALQSGKQAGTLQQSSSFVLGKTLSPRLTVSYSLNILNSINTLRLRYLLKKNWFLQTDSSTHGTGADVIYSIKK